MTTLSAAGRLLAIVKRAGQMNIQTNVYATWAQVFDMPQDQRASVYQAIAGLHRLIDQAKDEVRSHSELRQDLYLGALDNIETAVSAAQFHVNWGSYVGQFQGPNLIALEFVAEQFDRLSSEEVIEASVLGELRKEIERVIEEVLHSAIDKELRDTLISRLEEARHAILFYQLDGADGLRRATEGAIGAMVVVREAATSERGKAPVKSFLAILNLLLDVVAKAKPYAALAKPAIRALLSPGPGPDAS